MVTISETCTMPYIHNDVHICIMMYKALNGHTPTCISSMFTKKSEIHSRCLRFVDNDELHVPFSRTTYFESSFTITGAKQWNSLQADLRYITNIDLFKHDVKSFLLHSDEPV